MLKSELIKDIIKLKKLITTKKNRKKLKFTILISKLSEFLKLFTENKIIIDEQQSPIIKE